MGALPTNVWLWAEQWPFHWRSTSYTTLLSPPSCPSCPYNPNWVNGAGIDIIVEIVVNQNDLLVAPGEERMRGAWVGIWRFGWLVLQQVLSMQTQCGRNSFLEKFETSQPASCVYQKGFDHPTKCRIWANQYAPWRWIWSIRLKWEVWNLILLGGPVCLKHVLLPQLKVLLCLMLLDPLYWLNTSSDFF